MSQNKTKMCTHPPRHPDPACARALCHAATEVQGRGGDNGEEMRGEGEEEEATVGKGWLGKEKDGREVVKRRERGREVLRG